MGEHQAINCGLALSIIDRLKSHGVAINDSNIIEGLAKTHIPGRMEVLNTTPRIVVDGAHNAASIDAAMRAIGQHVALRLADRRLRLLRRQRRLGHARED